VIEKAVLSFGPICPYMAYTSCTNCKFSCDRNNIINPSEHSGRGEFV